MPEKAGSVSTQLVEFMRSLSSTRPTSMLESSYMIHKASQSTPPPPHKLPQRISLYCLTSDPRVNLNDYTSVCILSQLMVFSTLSTTDRRCIMSGLNKLHEVVKTAAHEVVIFSFIVYCTVQYLSLHL